VMLSMLHALGHDDRDSFGDSTGEFRLSYPAMAAEAAGRSNQGR